ncbi:MULTISPECIES: DNA-3-methyladenine glycosylase I [Aminobacterium]|jgi:DNA-3-methyladenine glycosylase I|nr:MULTISPECIES: DNA-3-methyladenine glycosylase I [Aminobacterium]MDD2379569.1 DNA-3-methyladenine glycosylase I [Aminobacterium colombiense]MDD3768335.1 DNA-3-methyladenine glycosylase I [Aminobacterium colombiense]MDD4265831.1 DNA-3-methyladenine glycosylase I [Aminobacterium colombiense]MDD4585976.1 DNA-3-methyladenine glycosylase I [Aminobacterium colombiense]
MIANEEMKRCPWAETHPLLTAYHDEEWGVPQYDEERLFELLILESAQAGLSWLTVLKKREGYRDAFAQFDVEKVAAFDQQKIEGLCQSPHIIQNRRKIAAAVNNARQFIAIAEKHGSFSRFLWSFVDNKPITNHWKNPSDVPASTPLSARLSGELKKRGFTFVGPIICYSYMQAVGMVNDHLIHCFCHGKSF